MEKEGENKKISEEIARFSAQFEKTKNFEDKKLIKRHIEDLRKKLRKSENVFGSLRKTEIKPLKENKTEIKRPEDLTIKKIREDTLNFDVIENLPFEENRNLERQTLKRIKRGEKIAIEKKIKKANKYVKISNEIFSDFSRKLEKKPIFFPLKRDLIKANLQFIPSNYISVILFTTLLSFVVSVFVFIFFLFFNIGAALPIITLVTERFLSRFLKIFWILLAIPLATFLFMYFYPAMEKKSAEDKINQELPFATIHMAAVSGSMIDPSNIFKIIVATGEYKYLEKEFVKLINEINIYGYDFVSALRRSAYNSPSRKLSELFNGLATTITSGGNLPGFFEKRAQSLLFEYRLEREKYTRSAETFMDIYISVVIAAPMILMLLLIMMSVSGLGISLGANMIALIMILGVSLINILFLTFLNLRQPAT